MIKIVGYDLLEHDRIEGVRYAWKDTRYRKYIESAAFVNKSKGKEGNICGYTTSVSVGCILKTNNHQCSFCRTGNLMPFEGLLTYKEIAKQNVFMVLADMYCDNYPELATKEREFAYMGQGEPGFSYSQVRMAIELTNKIMRELNQKVHRHIFATCGVPESIYCYKEDIKKYYTEKVTLHLSLHATDKRDLLMPINTIYPFNESLKALEDIAEILGEKPCVGIMLFNNFSPRGKEIQYTNSLENVMKIVNLLDPQKCRLSFCEYNKSDELGYAEEYNTIIANQILQKVRERGFEAKLFSSFGREKKAACGMLGGKEPELYASEKWNELNHLADELILKYTE